MKKILILNSPMSRAKGLSNVKDFDGIAIFIHERPSSVTYHNKGLLFDVSASFYDEAGNIIAKELLPMAKKGITQASHDNVKYVLEKRAWIGKILPRQYKNTRKALALISRVGRKVTDKIPILPIAGATPELTGSKLTYNFLRDGIREFATKVSTDPDLGAVTLGDALITAHSGLPLPVAKSYIYSKTLIKNLNRARAAKVMEKTK